MLLFEPSGIRYMNQEHETVLESAVAAGVFVENICGGNGSCGKCKVKTLVGEWNTVTPEEKEYFSREELAQGWRLACKLRPRYSFRSCEVLVEEENLRKEYEGDGYEKKYTEAIAQFNKMEARGAYEYAFSIDLGTTNVEALLWSVKDKQCLGRRIEKNSLIPYGADVISRITYAMKEGDNFHKLHGILQKQVKDLIQALAKQVSDLSEQLLQERSIVTVVGNAAMMHFFHGEAIDGLARAPYKTNYRDARLVSGSAMGLPVGKVLTVPNIESFVGADTVGVLWYLEQRVEKEPLEGTLVLDIGTNGEIGWYKNGVWHVASTAAGPAFEGASISCGMRAEVGAIKAITIRDSICVKTVGNYKPKGICGSGLVAVVAELLQCKVLDSNGYLRTGKEARIAGAPGCAVERLSEKGFCLAREAEDGRELYLSQKDIRQLQLAKAAIVAGLECLLEICQCTVEDIRKIYLAGAFGNYLPKLDARNIGLLPNIEIERIEAIGNAALLGASLVALQDIEVIGKLQELANNTKHVSLAEIPEFQEKYIKASLF